MKKILPVLFLFLALYLSVLPSNATNAATAVFGILDIVGNISSINDTERKTNYLPNEKPIFVQNISTNNIKRAIISYMSTKYWQVKSDSQYSLDLYRVRDEYGRLLLKSLRDSYGEYLYENNTTVTSAEQRIHFNFVEQNNGILLSFTVNVTTNPNCADEKSDYYQGNLSSAINDILQKLFIGSSNYNIKYSIKKDYVLISDNTQTLYEGNYRLGKNRKVVKVDDKEISEYKKSELKNLFKDCQKDKIKLEVNDNLGKYTVYLLRNFIEPAYKQYL